MQEVDKMNSDSLIRRMHTAGNGMRGAGGCYPASLHQINSSEIS